jgi:demethylmenaquinone methyltransferase / 2-methoxy-6-polyprenyl-1,4-benzoquinol methylase
MAASTLFTTDKKKHVRDMFNRIAFRYDFLNHFLSLGIDRYWRNRSVKQLKNISPKKILDIATGTGDFAVCSFRKLNPQHVTGIDISEEMLEFGRKKLIRKKLESHITLITGDSEAMPFEDKSFDAITVGFGVRNFEDLMSGLCEMFRVLKPGGRVVILEFSKPRIFPIKQLYHFYFRFILPLLGRIISKDKTAYTYLHDSVLAFPDRGDFVKLLNDAGFGNTRFISLSIGIASIYVGDKMLK